MLGLGHHAPLAIPTALLLFPRLIAELAEYPRWFAGLVPLPGSCMHLRPDDLPQPLVARHAQQEVHLMVFAPAHQFVAAETGISAQDDFHFRPSRPDLRYNSLDFRQAAEGCVVIGLSQSRA